jgi:hypothetical protein
MRRGWNPAALTSAFTALFLLGCGGERTPLPCEVQAVLSERCWVCHGEVTDFGAPMPLVSWEDMHDSAPTDGSKLVWQLTLERIADDDEPMPPRGFDRVPQTEIDILDAWVAAGAEPRAEEVSCD